MKSRAVVAGHAIHPMLIVFPLGLLATSVVWDICALASSHPRSWGMISFWTILAGVVGALLAAVPGFIDWLAIPKGTRARTIGVYHLTINLVVVALLAAVPGFIDWLAIPKGTRARTIGVYHLTINLVVVALFVVSLIGRWQTPGGYELAGPGWMILGWIAVALALVSGWLGGELVETLGISVREGANPNAPSPLSTKTSTRTPPSATPPTTARPGAHSVPVHRGV